MSESLPWELTMSSYNGCFLLKTWRDNWQGSLKFADLWFLYCISGRKESECRRIVADILFWGKLHPLPMSRGKTVLWGWLWSQSKWHFIRPTVQSCRQRAAVEHSWRGKQEEGAKKPLEDRQWTPFKLRTYQMVDRTISLTLKWKETANAQSGLPFPFLVHLPRHTGHNGTPFFSGRACCITVGNLLNLVRTHHSLYSIQHFTLACWEYR